MLIYILIRNINAYNNNYYSDSQLKNIKFK